MTRLRTRRYWLLAVGAAAIGALWLVRSGGDVDYSRIEVSTIDDLERELGALRERLDIPGLAAAVAVGDRLPGRAATASPTSSAPNR